MFSDKVRLPVRKSFAGQMSKTQKQFQKDCDIGRIVKHYDKYGVIPEGVNVRQPRYIDNSQIPTFQEAQDMMRYAEEVFLRVPIEIRRACDHNMAKVADFLADPNNKDVLKKYGLLKPEQEPTTADYIKIIAQNTKKEEKQPEAAAAQLPT